MPPLSNDNLNIALSSRKAKAIIERVENSDKETNILERLARVERQYRHLTIYGSIFFLLMGALLFVSLLFSISLARETYALNGQKSVQTLRQIIPSQPREKSSSPLKSLGQQRNPVH